MQDVINAATALFVQWKGVAPLSIDVLPQSGGERRYLRLHTLQETVIATYGTNVKENESFLSFSAHFSKRGLAVPQILCVSADRHCYLQEDLGTISLIDCVEEEGYTTDVYELYKKSVQELVRLQVRGNEGLDYTQTLTSQEFGKQAIMADLLYFKYYFLDVLLKPYDKQKLIDDFEALSTYLTHTQYKFFMFRDFQSRNIMVKNDDSVCFIDYQGGMKGAPQYDVASLLWQARAALPEDWKEKLLRDYMIALEQELKEPLNRNVFESQYNGYVLIRMLQVLGAYGFRGLFERKAHFLTSIPLALHNLKVFIEKYGIGIAVPELEKVLGICVDKEVIQRFTPVQANEATLLQVEICSFSYKRGIPPPDDENGGGFLFDCRGILNPGRVQEMKTLTGRDKPVRDFLEQQTKMPEFLNSVFDLVDISVEDYIKRGFTSLTIGFGCTGGQHRSVYAADALARHLRNKFKVKTNVTHIVQEAKNWINETY